MDADKNKCRGCQDTLSDNEKESPWNREFDDQLCNDCAYDGYYCDKEFLER